MLLESVVAMSCLVEGFAHSQIEPARSPRGVVDANEPRLRPQTLLVQGRSWR